MHLPRWGVATATVAALAFAVTPATAAPAAGTANPYPAVVNGIDVDKATVLDLQEAMDGHELTSAQLTAFYLNRIDQLNPLLHAVIETNPDASALAAASDASRAQHGKRSALEGIPVLLKDNVDTADREHTTAGSYALVNARPAADATLAARLRAAGAVILGKANLSEWANFRAYFPSSGWSGRGGQTNNPYVLDRNPCGSSSGSAVGAAADLAAVTIGTETDGSIVCPSGTNGVVGIKPTLGLVSRAGVIPISAAQDTAGPITRNVTDAAAVLSVIQGVDARDPATTAAGPYVGRDYLTALDPNALHGKRIGVWRKAVNGNAEVGAVLDAAVARLRAQGAEIVDNINLPGYVRQGPIDINSAEYDALLNEFKHDINAYLAATPGDHPDDLQGLIDFDVAHSAQELPYCPKFCQEVFEQSQATSGDLTDPSYLRERTTATRTARFAIDTTMAAHHLDAIVGPTNNAAWVTDLYNGDDYTGFVSTSQPAAVAGYPDLTVPAGYVRGYLPIGVSFFGGAYSEPTLIAAAYAFERSSQVRRPPTYLPTLP